MAVTITGNNTPTAGGVTYGDGSTYATTAAGSSGQSLLSSGSGAPTWGTPALATSATSATSATTSINLAGGVAGAIPYQSGSGATGFSAAGTSGQVLTSAGVGAPTWTTPSAGALVFISSQTVSSAVSSVDFTSGISSTYDDYVVYFSNVTPSANNVALYLRLYKGGAFLTSSYQYSYYAALPTPATAASNSTTFIQLMPTGYLNTSNSVTAGSCTFTQMNNTDGYRPTVFGNTFSSNGTSSNNMVTMFGGSVNNAAATTGFQFLFSSGNIVSGTFRLYGIAKS